MEIEKVYNKVENKHWFSRIGPDLPENISMYSMFWDMILGPDEPKKTLYQNKSMEKKNGAVHDPKHPISCACSILFTLPELLSHLYLIHSSHFI